MENGHNGGGLANVLSNRPLVVGALFLGTYFVPFLVFIGVALAYYFKRHEEEEWEPSHFSYLIRTFWIAVGIPFVVVIVAFAATVIASLSGINVDVEDVGVTTVAVVLTVMVPVLILCGVRIVLSLMKSVSQKPMPNPGSWLV
jgi:uncharacterized membrane protein